jgi:hypothetical protein
MKTRIIAAALAATTLFGGAAFAAQNVTTPQAAPAPRGHGGPLMRADANNDGVLTRAEVLADVDARFAKMDFNKDGKVTPDDRKAAFEKMRADWAAGKEADAKDGDDRPGRGWGRGKRGMGGPGMGKRFDANGDGAVTLDEQRAQALKVFDYVDRNHDGKVDQAERGQLRDVMMALKGPGRGPGGRDGHGHDGWGRHGGHGDHRGFGPPPGGDMPPPPPPADTPKQ